MAKDKERSVNPAAAQRKQDKQKTLKKGKAEALARRNEKLARRNPERIQRQINDFKSMEESGQKLRPRDKELLEALEKDHRAVLKAREALGDKAPKFHSGDGGQHHRQDRDRDGGDAVLGKRRRDSQFARYQESDSSETDEERKRGGGAQNEGSERRGPHALPSKPVAVVESKSVYEAKPEIRNLRQEAVNKFIPAAVRMKQDSIKGQGKLLEPEEMDKLEKAGYKANVGASRTEQPSTDEQRSLEEEEARFNREMRTVQIEEVSDEDA
ncbi:unnamed protein product [Penicillium manginii]